MARNRVRAVVRKAREGLAQQIASGVYTVALDLEGREMPLPIFITAPLIYVAEMVAVVLGKQHDWIDGRQEDVSRYVFAALQEVLVAMTAGFDREHFEAYVAAAQLQEQREG